jgi:hypothetical protein
MRDPVNSKGTIIKKKVVELKRQPNPITPNSLPITEG